ncbi:MAG: hypothetical protein AAGD96_19830, partial [Chloroflexota bacterium]
MKHKLIVNGADGPLSRQFGCSCTRCEVEKRQANVSVSLLSFAENGVLLHHVLFDAGEGVTD